MGRPFSHFVFWIAVLLTFSLPAGAHAQATADVVSAADDAFGSRFGDEAIGVYSENSVRGFDLESAGNFRIDGRYFVKSAGTSRFFVDRTDVRIGYNTLSLDFPGPSGVVDIKLRDPSDTNSQEVTLGFEPFGTLTADLLLNMSSPVSAYAGSIGIGAVLDGETEQGAEKSDMIVAGIAQAKPNDRTLVRVFFGEYHYKEQSATRIRLGTNATAVPPEIERRRYLGQDWAITNGARRLVGADARRDIGDGWRVEGNFVFTESVVDEEFTQLFLTRVDSGLADGRVVASPAQQFRAMSGEAILGWRGGAGRARHDLSLHGRIRRTRNQFGGEKIISLEPTLLGLRPAAAPFPGLNGASADLRDNVDQYSIGVSYQTIISERIRLNAGVLKTFYQKQFAVRQSGVATNSKTAPFLYNIGAAVRLTPRLELYGSYSRGLEESGRAPSTATNVNEVLSAGLSTQQDIGIRAEITSGITAFIAGFETLKPLPGLDPRTSVFELIGDVRHRGIEMSVSGDLSKSITLVAGGVYIDALARGPAVDQGLSGDEPVGVPSIKAIANVVYSPVWAMGLSLDGGVEFISARPVTASLLPEGLQLHLPDYFTANLGMRYTREISGANVTLRAQIHNLTDKFAWNVNQAESLSYIAPRSFRFVITSTF